MALNKIDLEVPLTMMRGVGLHVRSAFRNGPISIVHLNDMLWNPDGQTDRLSRVTGSGSGHSVFSGVRDYSGLLRRSPCLPIL